MSLEKIVKSPSGRVRRADAKAGKLHVRGKEPGYVYRIVNDIDDRVVSFQETGYEIVGDKDVEIGSKRVDVPSALGSVKQLSVGGGTKAVLMRQKDEYYHEDQAAKEAAIKKLEEGSKRDALNGNYGKLEVTHK